MSKKIKVGDKVVCTSKWWGHVTRIHPNGDIDMEWGGNLSDKYKKIKDVDPYPEPPAGSVVQFGDISERNDVYLRDISGWWRTGGAVVVDVIPWESVVKQNHGLEMRVIQQGDGK